MTRKSSDFIFPGVLSRLKILCLENEKRDAKKKYLDSQKMYVNTMLGRPMEKLNVRRSRFTRHAISSFKIPAMAGTDSAQTVTFGFIALHSSCCYSYRAVFN